MMNDRIEIVDLTDSGEGIGRLDTLTVFVEGTVPGDIAEVTLKELKKTYGIAELKTLVRPSENRVVPPCPYAASCGGCQIQNIDYQEQLSIKKRVVVDALERIGHQEDFEIFDTLGMEEPYHYRNKSSFPVSLDREMGFYRKRSHDLVVVDECLIQGQAMNEVLAELAVLVRNSRITIYDEKSHKGLLRHVVIRESRQKELMVIFVLRKNEARDLIPLVEGLKKACPRVTSIYLNVNGSRGNRILGYENHLLDGKEVLVDTLGEFQFRISPNSFFQVNTSQTEKLYEKVLEFADLQGDEVVFDLYCGIGSITHYLAKKAKKVYGIEIVGAAIDDAILNTELNRLVNVEYLLGRVEEEIHRLVDSRIQPDLVVVDPPRKGLETKLIDTLIDLRPDKIVYVSCKPSTLARDVRIFTQNGYRLVKVQPVDMFPHTTHVECVVKLEK